MKHLCIRLFLLFLAFFPVSQYPTMEATAMSTLKISSPAFKHNEPIPSKFTCDGVDVNPALTIEDVPAGAKTLALIMDDPDAPRGTWVHWVVWNISPMIKAIRENSVPDGGKQGVNDFRKHDYGGPCPPSGTHRYFFKLYALGTTLNLSPETTKSVLEDTMRRHILAQSELIGKYTR